MAAAPRAGSARSKRILERVFLGEREGFGDATIGRVRFVGEGLFRKAYAAEVQSGAHGSARSGPYVVLLPKPGVEPEFTTRVRREATILHIIHRMVLPFRVPRIAGVIPDENGPALVEEFAEGVPLEFRSRKHPGAKPWEVVGRLAAGVHDLDRATLAPILGGHATRRQHGEACLSVFEGLDEPLLRDARDWARAHLPPDVPGCVVHGDLLGQNIIRHVHDPRGRESAYTLIDWEFACRGDPAYDLAVVTRGVRRPFQVNDGLEKLLDAHARAGGTSITVSQVRFHEICLVGGWYRDALERPHGGHPSEHHLQQLRALLRRATEE